MSNWPKFRRSKGGVDTIISHEEALELLPADRLSMLTGGNVRQLTAKDGSWLGHYSKEDALKDAAPELLAALESFLRAPSIGSNGPGSVSIEVQSFNLKAAHAACKKARGE